MSRFRGFPPGKVRFTRIPAQFFSELLPQIDHLGELKVMLYTLWRLDRMEGSLRYLRESDFIEDERFMVGLDDEPDKAKGLLSESLARAVKRGSLLKVEVEVENGPQHLYLLNTPRGQAAVQAIQRGEWQPSGNQDFPIELGLERPNIFRLYEEHIGPITPMIAESLKEAETTYPVRWIEEAVRIAVENNARRWRYIEAILRSWREEGRDERRHQKGTRKDRRKYVEGEFSDFIEH